MTRGRAGLNKSERKIEMNVDHPFLFIIRNTDLPLGHDILFISKVEDLKEEEKNDEKQKKENNFFNKFEEVKITNNKPVKWYIYSIKQILKFRETVDIKARPLGASHAIRVSETLKKLGYISYVKYYTTTVIQNERIQRYIFIKVKKTKDFQRLYDEREKERNKELQSTY